MKWNRKKGLILTALLMVFSLTAALPSEAAENYRIGIGKDQTVEKDKTVSLDVTVSAPGGVFQTADMTFSYDKEYLSFDKNASTGLDGYTVQEQDGKLRILRYGEQQKEGRIFQLAFRTEKAGTTRVKIDSARMDTGNQAVTRDAPEATCDPKEAVLTVKEKTGKKHHSSSGTTEETTTSGAQAAASPQQLTSAKTGDPGYAVWILTAVVALTGCIWIFVRKRKKYEQKNENL